MNEIKRLQHLAGIINENEDDDFNITVGDHWSLTRDYLKGWVSDILVILDIEINDYTSSDEDEYGAPYYKIDVMGKSNAKIRVDIYDYSKYVDDELWESWSDDTEFSPDRFENNPGFKQLQSYIFNTIDFENNDIQNFRIKNWDNLKILVPIKNEEERKEIESEILNELDEYGVNLNIDKIEWDNVDILSIKFFTDLEGDVMYTHKL
jgi:hypothetical protein